MRYYKEHPPRPFVVRTLFLHSFLVLIRSLLIIFVRPLLLKVPVEVLIAGNREWVKLSDKVSYFADKQNIICKFPSSIFIPFLLFFKDKRPWIQLVKNKWAKGETLV